MICIWKGFYHNGRETKKYKPFPYAELPQKTGNALAVNKLWNMHYFCK